jgi:hypothetical protein
MRTYTLHSDSILNLIDHMLWDDLAACSAYLLKLLFSTTFRSPCQMPHLTDLESQADEVGNYETAWQRALYDQVKKLKLYSLMDYLRKSNHQDD